MRTHTRVILPALAAALLLTASACGADAADTSAEASETPASITVEDPWAKAAESGMTSSFVLLTNTGEEDVTLTAVESSVSDEVQLHETADDGSGSMSMSEKEGGFTIPADDSLELAPGGDHIMLMDLAEPLVAGDTLDLVLVFDDGSRVEYDAQIRDFAGADEDYGDEHEDHGGEESDHADESDHDHGDESSHDHESEDRDHGGDA